MALSWLVSAGHSSDAGSSHLAFLQPIYSPVPSDQLPRPPCCSNQARLGRNVFSCLPSALSPLALPPLSFESSKLSADTACVGVDLLAPSSFVQSVFIA